MYMYMYILAYLVYVYVCVYFSIFSVYIYIYVIRYAQRTMTAPFAFQAWWRKRNAKGTQLNSRREHNIPPPNLIQ